MSQSGDIQFFADRLSISFEEAEERMAHSRDLFEAADALELSTGELMLAISLRLEGREDDDGRWHKARRKFDAALDRMEVARKEAVRFLYAHGGRSPDGHLDAVWEAMREADEEALSDAASAYREGTITRREFDERRAALQVARAKLDAEVDASLAAAVDDD